MLIPYLASNFFVDEVGLTLKHIPRKITVYDHEGKSSHNWPADAHTVTRITSTKTRKEWYLDFSGVQFGIYRTLWGFTEFKSAHRAVEIEGPGPFPFGTCRASLKEIDKMPGPSTLICGAVGEVAEHLNTTAAGWATDCDGLGPSQYSVPRWNPRCFFGILGIAGNFSNTALLHI
jgi:hypothetical protein